MTPLYFEPAVGLSSTVALTLFTPRAMSLYFSSSSSRVASRTTGLVCGGNLVGVLMVRPPQPQETAPSVTQTLQFRTRTFHSGALTDLTKPPSTPPEHPPPHPT